MAVNLHEAFLMMGLASLEGWQCDRVEKAKDSVAVNLHEAFLVMRLASLEGWQCDRRE